jgi:hypothetical protein
MGYTVGRGRATARCFMRFTNTSAIVRGRSQETDEHDHVTDRSPRDLQALCREHGKYLLEIHSHLPSMPHV